MPVNPFCCLCCSCHDMLLYSALFTEMQKFHESHFHPVVNHHITAAIQMRLATDMLLCFAPFAELQKSAGRPIHM